MKQIIVLCLSMLLAVGVLAACGGNSENTSNNNTDTGGDTDASASESNSDEIVTLNFFNGKVEIHDQALEMIQEFEEENPNIEVKLESVGGGADGDAALKAKFSSGEAPDIFTNGGFKQLDLWKEHLADLSDEPWAEHVLPFAKVPMTDEDGKLFGRPVNLEGYGFIYNKDLFEQAGITEAPKTISELEEAAQKLEAADITAFAAGYGEWWVIGQHLLNVPFAHQEDPAAFIEGLDAGSETIAGNEAFENFKKVIDLEINYGNQNPLTTDYNTQVTLFATGEAAIMQQGNWTENMIYEINPEMNMAFLPIPLSDEADADRLPVGVPNSYVINKNSEHLEEAKFFLDWMTSSETGKRYMTEVFAFIPALDNVEASGLGALGESILEYSTEDKTIPWTWFQWPDGASKDFGAAIQEYSADQIEYDEVLEKFQATWENLK